MASEFLHARLAAAAAIPPERRSADVSTLLEYCQLQQEVLDAMAKPGGGQLTCLDALKLARAEYIAPCTLDYSPKLHQFLAEHVLGLLDGEGSMWD